jgi:hypothetical protein
VPERVALLGEEDIRGAAAPWLFKKASGHLGRLLIGWPQR